MTGKLSLMPMTASNFQTTLRNAIHCTGIGLHTGERTRLTLSPAPINTGILFRRLLDGERTVEIPALWSNAVETALCTVLTDGHGVTIMTVEHLMAALAGYGVDNCTVELDGPEVPILDGSAEPFVFLLECAGVIKQLAPRKSIKILKSIRIGNEAAWAMIEPDDVFAVDFEIDFPNSVIGRQTAGFVSKPAASRKRSARPGRSVSSPTSMNSAPPERRWVHRLKTPSSSTATPS